MVNFYPSHQALALADQMLNAIAERVPGYQGRIGAKWYWRLNGGILITLALDYSITEQRWDILRAVAVTPTVGQFNAADFPFAAYGTLLTSPPFIHDLEGSAEWSNRLYFQMGHLIEDCTLWLKMLLAALIDPQILPPSSYPSLNALEQELVNYALNERLGYFTVNKLHAAFTDRVSRRQLSRLAQRWEDRGLLTEKPRRVTIALRALAEEW